MNNFSLESFAIIQYSFIRIKYIYIYKFQINDSQKRINVSLDNYKASISNLSLFIQYLLYNRSLYYEYSYSNSYDIFNHRSWNFSIFPLLIKEWHLTKCETKNITRFPSKRLISTRETPLNTTVSRNLNQEHHFPRDFSGKFAGREEKGGKKEREKGKKLKVFSLDLISAKMHGPWAHATFHTMHGSPIFSKENPRLEFLVGSLAWNDR